MNKKLRYIAKSLVHGSFGLSGYLHHCRKQLQGKLIILTYHSFCDKCENTLFHSLPVKRFEQQILFLKKKFKVVSLDQGLDYLQHAQIVDKPLVAITIDDGFQDNYTQAWPILQYHGIPFAIFLSTDFLDTGRAPWPTQILEILEKTRLHEMQFPFKADLSTLSSRNLVARKLKKYLTPLTPEQKFEIINEIRKILKVDKSTWFSALSWDQVREMRSKGVLFGSHTVYHSTLPFVDDDVAQMEISESKKRLEEELQEPCVNFAYPNGNYGNREKMLLEKTGYRLALSQNKGVNEQGLDKFSLYRIEIPYHDPLATFRARVSYSI